MSGMCEGRKQGSIYSSGKEGCSVWLENRMNRGEFGKNWGCRTARRVAVLAGMTSHSFQCCICFLTFTLYKNFESSIITPIFHKRNLSSDKVKLNFQISQVYIGRKWQRQDLDSDLIGFLKL